MRLEVHRFTPDREKDFFRLHTSPGAGWCFCAAWWVPTWEGWGERTSEDNRNLRERLCEAGEYDGYLLYADSEPVGWCQVGPRDRLKKLVSQFELAPSPGTWAITCFLIAPGFRRRGLASYFLQQVIAGLRNRGVRRVEAFPKRGKGLSEGDLWTGPEAMFHRAGFGLVRDDPTRPILGLDLEPQ
jgi:GNAT superfamily N-acetyltransferase